MPKPTKEERIAKLEAEFHKLVMKHEGQGQYKGKEAYFHEIERHRHHDKLTTDQKKMNELERKIRILKGKSGGRRATRRHRRTRHRTRRHH